MKNDQPTQDSGKNNAKPVENTFSEFQAFTGLPIDQRVQTLETLVRSFSILKKPVSAEPTYTPTNFYDSIVYYVNGSTHRVYFYTTGWHYVALT